MIFESYHLDNINQLLDLVSPLLITILSLLMALNMCYQENRISESRYQYGTTSHTFLLSLYHVQGWTTVFPIPPSPTPASPRNPLWAHNSHSPPAIPPLRLRQHPAPPPPPPPGPIAEGLRVRVRLGQIGDRCPCVCVPGRRVCALRVPEDIVQWLNSAGR